MTTPSQTAPFFLEAAPIWPTSQIGVMNATVGFRTVFEFDPLDSTELLLTGASLYRVTIDGEFFAHGPARAAHGYARVDHLPLPSYLDPGPHVLAIEVAGYAIENYYLPYQPSFLQAELRINGKVIAATGHPTHDFQALLPGARQVRVQRFSFQRTFIEEYHLTPGFDAWRLEPDAPFSLEPCTPISPAPSLLPRAVEYPDYLVQKWTLITGHGSLVPTTPTKLWKDRSLTLPDGIRTGYREESLPSVLSTELQHYRTLHARAPRPPFQTPTLAQNQWTILSFDGIYSGFIGLQFRCNTPTRLILTFDEILQKNDVDFKRLTCVAGLALTIEPGTYSFESIEPYELKYLKFHVLQGDVIIQNAWIREYANPMSAFVHFACDTFAIDQIFRAGTNSFRQNAVDLFMDCPSRERSGWLCDSLFTARVEADLCGNNAIEHNFLENYLLPTAFPGIPDGMVPMTYPADHPNGEYIPNWGLWFVLELEESLARTGDSAFIQAFRPRVENLFRFFQAYENEFGLLEKLDRWVFVEWSAANSFTQDVNYPTNMLYAGALDAAARLYHHPEWHEKATALRKTIRHLAFDGEFFIDHAIRQEGDLLPTRDRTETCQYYAFYFDIATPESDPSLWHHILHDFGPKRKNPDPFPDIHPSNALIGSDLRLEILSRYGHTKRLLRDLYHYRFPMANLTETLWENLSTEASCNHGFASHSCHVILRDGLGLHNVDYAQKHLSLRLTNNGLHACIATFPLGPDSATIAWKKGPHRTLSLETFLPPSWTLSIQNFTRHRLSTKNSHSTHL